MARCDSCTTTLRAAPGRLVSATTAARDGAARAAPPLRAAPGRRRYQGCGDSPPVRPGPVGRLADTRREAWDESLQREPHAHDSRPPCRAHPAVDEAVWCHGGTRHGRVTDGRSPEAAHEATAAPRIAKWWCPLPHVPTPYPTGRAPSRRHAGPLPTGPCRRLWPRWPGSGRGHGHPVPQFREPPRAARSALRQRVSTPSAPPPMRFAAPRGARPSSSGSRTSSGSPARASGLPAPDDPHRPGQPRCRDQSGPTAFSRRVDHSSRPHARTCVPRPPRPGVAIATISDEPSYLEPLWRAVLRGFRERA